MCVWIKYTSYQWCWQGWRLFLMSTAIKLMCTWQDVKKKSNPFKTKSNVKKVHSGLYKQHVIADRNNLYSHSTRVPSLDPKEQDLHYSWFRPRQPGEMLWSVSWNTDTGGLPNSFPGREENLSFAVTTSKCHSSNGKENHKHVIYFEQAEQHTW